MWFSLVGGLCWVLPGVGIVTHLSGDWADTKYDPADLNQSHNINIVLQRYKQPPASQPLESNSTLLYLLRYTELGKL